MFYTLLSFFKKHSTIKYNHKIYNKKLLTIIYYFKQ